MRYTRGAIGATVLAVAVTGCAGASGVRPADSSAASTVVNPTTTMAPPPTAYGGTIVVGIPDLDGPRSLNPLVAGPDAAALDLLAPAIFAQGFDVDPVTGAPLPDAIRAVPSAADGTLIDLGDGTVEVRYEVVEGAVWSDGAPMTAADLEYTYLLATDAALPIRSDLVATYSRVVPGSARAEGRVFTARLRAGTDPARLFGVIVPRHAVEGSDFATDWNRRAWPSGGPFLVSGWEPGQHVDLAPNQRYWKVTAAEGAPLPFLDRLVVRFYEPGPELDPRLVEDFGRAELAVVAFGRATDRSKALTEALGAGAVLETAPDGEWEHLNFQFGPANRNPDSENPSLTLRRAVAHAIDRDTLAASRGTAVVDSILGQYVPGLGGAPFARYAHDPEETARLLGGSSPHLVVTVAADDARSLALGGDVVTMLRGTGFDAELQLEDADSLFGTTLDNGTWDVGMWRIGAGSGLQRALALLSFYDPDGLPFVGTNFFRWGTVDSLVRDGATEEYRRIMDEIAVTGDPARLAELAIAAEAILADQVVLLPLVGSGEIALAHWPASLVGPAINAIQGPLWNVDVWRIPTGSG